MRITYLLFILCLLFQISCTSNSNDSKDQPKSDSAARAINADSVSQPTANEKVAYKNFNAFIIDGSANLYKDSLPGAQKIRTLKYLEQLNIEDKSNMTSGASDKEGCDGYGYYWYKVKTSVGESGWVYGTALLQKAGAYFASQQQSATKLQTLLDKEVKIGGKTFYFDSGVELNIGSFNDEGLTGCDIHFFPYFYDSDGKIYFFNADKSIFVNKDFLIRNDKNGKLMMTLNSGDGAIDLKGIYSDKWQGNDVVVLSNDHSYQDGGASSNIYISWKDDHFEALAYVLNRSANQ
jgi:hypothetical protein